MLPRPQYAEMEMRHRFVNHARNVWDRAVSLLPRVDQLWYKYIHMEEMLGNVAGARQVGSGAATQEDAISGFSLASCRFMLPVHAEAVCLLVREAARRVCESCAEAQPSCRSCSCDSHDPFAPLLHSHAAPGL